MEIIEEQLRRFEQLEGSSRAAPMPEPQESKIEANRSSSKQRRFSDFDFIDIGESQLSKITEKLQSILVEHCRWRGRSAGDVLGRQLKATQEGRMPGIRSKALSIAHPINCCFQSGPFLFLCAAFFVYHLWTAINILTGFRAFGVSNISSVKVVVGPSTKYLFQSTLPSIISFQLLYQGCPIASANLTSSTTAGESQGSVVRFESPISADGFAVSTDSEKGGIASVAIFGSDSSGDTWSLFGRSDFRAVPEGVRPLDNALNGAPQRLKVDYSLVWPLVADSAVTKLLLASGFLAATLFAACGLPLFSKRASSCTCIFVAIIQLAAGIGYACLGLPRDCFSPLVHCLIFACASASFHRPDTHFPLSLIGLSGLSLATRIVQDAALFRDPGYLAVSPPYMPIAGTLLGLLLLAQRQAFIRSAVRVIAESAARGDAHWWQLTVGEHIAGDLQRLDLVCQTIKNSISAAPRQLFRAPAPSNLSSGIWSPESDLSESPVRDPDSLRPVRSLDQLYSQAMGLSPLLRALCRRWAGACGASIAAFETQATAAADSAVYGEIVRGESIRFLKYPARAVEKAIVCYGGDVSRLLDVCRCRLLFDRVEDITDCLESIHNDHSVKIVRVKNFMQPSGPSYSCSGFFRAVVVNLRVDNIDTRLLGVENHVCELQMIWTPRDDVQESSPEEKATAHCHYLDLRAAMVFRSQWRCQVAGPALFGQESQDSARKPQELTADIFILPHTSAQNIERRLEKELEESRLHLLAVQDDCIALEITQDAQDPSTSRAQTAAPNSFDDPQGAIECSTTQGSAELDSTVAVSETPEISRWNTAGLDNDRDLKKAIVKTFLRSTLLPGGYLDGRKHKVEKAIRFSDSGSSAFTSKPFSASLCKKKYAFLAFLISVYFAYLGYLAIRAALVGGVQFRSTILRFTAVELRNPAIAPNHLNISSLGVLQRGCKVAPTAMKSIDNTFYALYDHATDGNGFYFVTSPSSPDLDPFKWYVQVSDNNGSSWTAVASSVMMIKRDGSISFSITLPYILSVARNHAITIDLRITWEWIVCWIGAGLFTFLAYFLTAVAGVCKREDSAKSSWVVMNLLATLMLVVVALGYSVRGLSLDSTYHWLNVIPSLFLALGLWFYESKYVMVIIIYGFIRGGAVAIQSVVLYQKPWLLFAAQDFPLSTSPMAFLLVFLLTLYRQQVLYHARGLVRPDIERYNKLWDTIKVESLEALLQLTAEAGNLAQKCPTVAPKQVLAPTEDFSEYYNSRSFLGVKFTELKCTIIPFQLNRDAIPLDSTDQLFVQAGCLHPLLLLKARTWALVADGGFPVMFSRCPSFPKYADIKDDDSAEVKYGKLKSADRSLEKLVRSYNMDPSLLVDICRQTIVFSDIDSITKCLKMIGEDPDVRLVRIKNRMDPSYDGRQSLGYRNISINLKLVTAQTSILGLDTHVCELQLLLAAIAEIKNDEGHKRYVAFRNLRGE